MEQIGVPTKQKERARQTFVKSAQYAGFIDQQTGRLVRPATGPMPPTPEEIPDKGGGGDDGSGLALDPLLIALLRKIPSTAEGWPKERRLRWFRTFAMNVSQVYDKPEDAVDFEIKMAQSNDGLGQ
jgi:hypothetical protein